MNESYNLLELVLQFCEQLRLPLEVSWHLLDLLREFFFAIFNQREDLCVSKLELTQISIA